MPRRPHEKLPSNPSELEGVTKAAILLVAVGEEAASTVLGKMETETVEELMRELAGLGRVPDALQAAVVEDFYNISVASRYMNEGNLDFAKQVLMSSMDPKQAERVLQQIQTQVQKTPFSFLQRAEAAGYGAIVVTIDNAFPGWKPRDLQNAYLPFLDGEGLANFFADPVFRDSLDVPPEEDAGAAVGRFVGVFGNPALTWNDLDWLRAETSLPIVLKGVLHPDDAREARERGVDGIAVSNHGGRQVDGAIAAVDALPAIADAVGDELAILFDSGIRSGADAVKALALGADAVLLGRPYLWGMALEGAEGVEKVLRHLLAELDLTMALSGCTKPAELETGMLVRRD